MNYRSLLVMAFATGALLLFQNCSQPFEAQKASLGSLETPNPNNPSPGTGENPGVEDGTYQGALPPAGQLLLKNDFSSQAETERDFSAFAAPASWAATRDRGGNNPRRDPVHEEGHYSNSARTVVSETVNGLSTLTIRSEPNISEASGMTPEACDAAIMGLRAWRNFDTNAIVQNGLDENGRWLSNNGRGKIQVFQDQPAEYLDALDNCRLYTGRVRSNQKFGPGKRIQVRVNLSGVYRTGHIHHFRLAGSDNGNDPNPPIDMSVFEHGWAERWIEQDINPTRSWLNTAIRWNGGSFAYFLDTATNDLAGFYEFQSGWNSYFMEWYNSDQLQQVTQLASAVPPGIDALDGWYIYTIDWRHDKVEFYLQKENDDGEPIRYLATTDPRMVSKSCNQEIWLGDTISQTFSETNDTSIWKYVDAQTDFVGMQNITSEQFPGGRSYRQYSSESMQVDWLKVYDLPGGAGDITCD